MKKMLLLVPLFLAYSCGGGAGGGTSSYEGFYKLDGSIEQEGKYAVLRVVRNDDGSIKEAYIPDSSFDAPLILKLKKTYSGTSRSPMRTFIKKVKINADGHVLTVPTSGEEITESGIKLSITLPVSAKVSLPFLYGNELEDTTESYAGVYTLAEESDNWMKGEKSVTYTGNSTTITVGKEIKDVSVFFDDINCPINGDILQSPCTGNIDFENGTITAGIDASYLSTDHSVDLTVETNTYQTILSQKVVPNTISITGGKLSLTDDGSGNLTGTGGNGTIDYATGKVILNIDNSTFDYKETEEDKEQWISFSDNGSLQLPQNLKPLSLRLEATNSTDVSSGSDSGSSSGSGNTISIIATCSDDGHGNLIGACSGTVNYKTGEVDYDWDDSITDGKNVKLSYTYTIQERQPLSLTVSWKTEDKNMDLKVSYKELSDKAQKTYFFSTPGKVDEVEIYDGENKVTPSIVTYETTYGSLVKVTLPDFPRSTLKANYVSERKFNFNKNETVIGQKTYTVPVDVEVTAELENNRELKKTFHTTVTAATIEENESFASNGNNNSNDSNGNDSSNTNNSGNTNP